MTQAKTNTSTILDPSRRRFLAQAAGVAAGGAALGMALPLPASAGASARVPDPILAAIKTHRSACRTHLAAIAEQNRLERLGAPDAEAVAEAPCHAEWDAFYELLETAPLTLASLTAWSAYLDEIRQNNDWRLEGVDICYRIVGTLATTLRNLAASS